MAKFSSKMQSAEIESLYELELYILHKCRVGEKPMSLDDYDDIETFINE